MVSRAVGVAGEGTARQRSSGSRQQRVRRDHHLAAVPCRIGCDRCGRAPGLPAHRRAATPAAQARQHCTVLVVKPWSSAMKERRRSALALRPAHMRCAPASVHGRTRAPTHNACLNAIAPILAVVPDLSRVRSTMPNRAKRVITGDLFRLPLPNRSLQNHLSKPLLGRHGRPHRHGPRRGRGGGLRDG